MSRFLAAMYRDLAKEFRLEAAQMHQQADSLERQADALMSGADFFQGKTIPRGDGVNPPVRESTDSGTDAVSDGAVAKSGPAPWGNA